MEQRRTLSVVPPNFTTPTAARSGHIPTTDGEGPWYDWVTVEYDPSAPGQLIPCKLLSFFKLSSGPPGDNEQQDIDPRSGRPYSGIYALIHPTDYPAVSYRLSDAERERRLYKTQLCERFQLWSHQVTVKYKDIWRKRQTRKFIRPRLQVIAVEQIVENVLAEVDFGCLRYLPGRKPMVACQVEGEESSASLNRSK
jgi:hypothetical protein